MRLIDIRNKIIKDFFYVLLVLCVKFNLMLIYPIKLYKHANNVYHYKLGFPFRIINIHTESIKTNAFDCIFGGNSYVYISLLGFLFNLFFAIAIIGFLQAIINDKRKKSKLSKAPDGTPPVYILPPPH